MRARWVGFAPGLALIALAGAALRLAHLLAVAPHTAGVEDAFWFREVSRNIASGHGFALPVGSVFSPGFHLAATAAHPPLYALLLAVPSKLGIGGDEAQRSIGVLLGALTVVLVGLCGRRLAGERAGLVAAALAAVHPLLIAADGALLSETLYTPIVAGLLLAALRAHERPSLGRWALLGAMIGLATLTRAEAILFLPLLALPLAWRAGLAGGSRWASIAVAAACAALVLAPWVVRNWSTFGRPLISNNQGGLVAGANCRAAYHGPATGSFVPSCQGSAAAGNEADAAAHWQRRGLRYASAHAGRVPVVMAARVLRGWSLFRPFDRVQEQGRSANVERVGIGFDYLLMLLAVPGLVLLQRLGAPLLPPLAPVAVVTITAALSYGSVRLRDPAELSLVLLAAAGVEALLRRRAAPARRAPR